MPSCKWMYISISKNCNFITFYYCVYITIFDYTVFNFLKFNLVIYFVHRFLTFCVYPMSIMYACILNKYIKLISTTSNMKVSTSSRMSSSVKEGSASLVWINRSRKAVFLPAPGDRISISVAGWQQMLKIKF